MVPSATQLSAMSRMFSSAVFHEMAKTGQSPLFSRLIQQIDLSRKNFDSIKTAGHAFDKVFRALKKVGLRDEYVYRTALIQNVLLKKHSLTTASMMAEFRAGNCKADLVILNGTSTVYEIKSERDSLARLANQMENYGRVFAKTYVITSETHLNGVKQTVPADVGILFLSSRFTIEEEREALDRPERVCPVSIFQSIRSGEAKSILNQLDVDVPDVPNTQLYAAMRERFKQLNGEDVHGAMLNTLRRTRDLTPLTALIDKLPKSLYAAALSIPVNRKDHDRIVDAVSTPIREAIEWN